MCACRNKFGEIHPEIIRLGLKFEKEKIRDADERAHALLASLKEVCVCVCVCVVRFVRALIWVISCR